MLRLLRGLVSALIRIVKAQVNTGIVTDGFESHAHYCSKLQTVLSGTLDVAFGQEVGGAAYKGYIITPTPR
jgi:hypothetical protein